MNIEYPAKRGDVPILAGIAGGTGSGKTYSALRLATGLAGDKPFAVIDTEANRAKHYADLFNFAHIDLQPPFRPERYEEAILEAEAAGYPVIVVDSFSHEYAGEGGLLDWHEEELERMVPSGNWKEREAKTFAAWVRPKMHHKAFVQKLLQLRSHLIVCLRAEEKIELVKGQDGKLKVVPKRTLSGHEGWIPVAEKSFAYELTLSLVLTPDAPGMPKPIKLQEQHKPFLPLNEPISEATGRALAEWAKGSGAATGNPSSAGTPAPDDSGALATPPPTEAHPSGGTPGGAPAPTADKPLTHYQANKKMDAIIGQLREAGAIQTLHLYQAVAADRNIVKEIEVDGETKKVADVETMAAFIDGAYGEDGELHWAPLREDLTLKEARLLHARLANMWLRVENNLPKAAA